MRLFTLLEQLLQDVRYAARMMVARPVFSAVAALLRVLPVADPDLPGAEVAQQGAGRPLPEA